MCRRYGIRWRVLRIDVGNECVDKRIGQEKTTTINRSGDAAVVPIGSVAGEGEGKMSRKVGVVMSRVNGGMLPG